MSVATPRAEYQVRLPASTKTPQLEITDRPGQFARAGFTAIVVHGRQSIKPARLFGYKLRHLVVDPQNRLGREIAIGVLSMTIFDWTISSIIGLVRSIRLYEKYTENRDNCARTDAKDVCWDLTVPRINKYSAKSNSNDDQKVGQFYNSKC